MHEDHRTALGKCAGLFDRADFVPCLRQRGQRRLLGTLGHIVAVRSDIEPNGRRLRWPLRINDVDHAPCNDTQESDHFPRAEIE